MSLPESIHLEIVTPERHLLMTPASSVVVPASEGEMEILDGHTPLMSSLKTGVLSFYNAGSETKLMVSGGFVQVELHRVTILCESAALPDEVDAPELRKKLDELREQLAALSTDDPNLKRVTLEMERALISLDIAK